MIFDINAQPSLAVTAWLAQFKVEADGSITYVSGSDTFHVKWINASLQKLAWDFLISGDDEINLSKPNPSSSQALGTIITLENHPSFNVRYNINQEATEYHFGGSISQQNASGNIEAWYAASIEGNNGGNSLIQVIQNESVVPSHWGSEKNVTGEGIIARVLIKVIEDGQLIDGGRITVKSHDFQNNYSNATRTLGLTETSIPANGDNDPFNNSLISSVAGYGISKSEGYNELDLDTNGNKPYLGSWSYSPRSAKIDLYEYVKYLLSRDSGQTIYGVDANIWTGRIIEIDIDSGSGNWVQNERITWSTGAGNLVGFDNSSASSTNRIWVHLGQGLSPLQSETINSDGGANAEVGAGNSTTLAVSPNLLGQFVGSWIGGFGVGFDASQVTNTDSFTDLNGNTISPPSFVSINGTVTTVDSLDEPHVYLTKRTGNSASAPEFTLESGNNSGNSTLVVNAPIPPDTPQSGYLGILGPNSAPKFYKYTSWSLDTFNLDSNLEESYSSGDLARLAYFYESALGSGNTKTVSSILIYQDAPIDVIGWVRNGSSDNADTPIPISGQIGAGGFQFNVTLTREP